MAGASHWTFSSSRPDLSERTAFVASKSLMVTLTMSSAERGRDYTAGVLFHRACGQSMRRSTRRLQLEKSPPARCGSVGNDKFVSRITPD